MVSIPYNICVVADLIVMLHSLFLFTPIIIIDNLFASLATNSCNLVGYQFLGAYHDKILIGLR